MNCENAEILMSSYIDNELDSTQKLELEAHLNSCHECKVLLNLTQKGNKLVGGYIKSLSLTDGITEAVMTPISFQPQNRHVFSKWAFFGKCACIAALAFLFYYLRPSIFIDNYKMPFASASLACFAIGLAFIVLNKQIAQINSFIIEKISGMTLLSLNKESLAFRLWGIFFTAIGLSVNFLL